MLQDNLVDVLVQMGYYGPQWLAYLAAAYYLLARRLTAGRAGRVAGATFVGLLVFGILLFFVQTALYEAVKTGAQNGGGVLPEGPMIALRACTVLNGSFQAGCILILAWCVAHGRGAAEDAD